MDPVIKAWLLGMAVAGVLIVGLALALDLDGSTAFVLGMVLGAVCPLAAVLAADRNA